MLSHETQSLDPNLPSVDSTPRLVIHKMALINFKSYAGRIEIGPFHKSFSSIVGPNGSGKSNVIDALLFVFGFKAKKMRQGKLSELIHNSTHFQHLTWCSVEVHFQEIIDTGKDTFDLIPNSDILISRSVEKDPNGKADKSVYRINQRTSSFTEVTTLLKGKGVDLDHKRFLILQGEVESISLMKPKAQNEHEEGLLEYLEDIIGTSCYKEPIEEGQKVLETLSEEREEKLSRLKLVEKDKNSLESKKDETLQFIQLSNDITRKKNQYSQVCIVEYSSDLEYLQAKANEITLLLSTQKETYNENKQKVDLLEKDYTTLEMEHKEMIKASESVSNELQKYEKAEVEWKEKEKHLNSKKKKTSKALVQDNHSQSEHQSWLGNFEGDIQSNEDKLNELHTTLAKEEGVLDKIRENLKGKTQVFQKQIEEKQMELAPWTEKVNQKQASMDVLKMEFNLLDEKLNRLDNDIQKVETRQAELKPLEREKKKELQELTSQFEFMKQDLEKKRKLVQSTKTLEVQAKEEWMQARQACDEAKNAKESMSSRGNMYNHLMRQSDTGKIKGICGRLGNLGVISDQYDVAVTTACGSLDSILVETVEAGQQCIEFLKKNNLGRANFMCLDKLKSWDMSPITTPENVPRLFDLIKPKEERFKPAFYQALNDTLVSKDLDQANRIAFGKKRFRVVTLDGQLIDTAGTMSGGGNKPQKGGMSSKFASDGVSQTQIQKLENAEKACLNNLEMIRQNAQEYTCQVDELTKSLPKLELEISKSSMNLDSIKTELEDLSSHMEALMKQERPSEAEVAKHAQLESDITRTEKELQKLLDSASVIEGDIKQLEEKILDVGGVRLRSQKAMVDGIQEQICGLKDKITKLKVEKGTREKNLTKVSKSIESKTMELKEIEKELESIKAQQQEESQLVQKIRNQVSEYKDMLMDKEGAMESLKKSIEESTEIMNEIRRNQVELKAQCAEANQNVSTRTRQIKQLEDEIKGLAIMTSGFEKENEMSLDLVTYSVEQLTQMDKENLSKELSELETELAKSKPDMDILDEYKRKLSIYIARAKDLEDITQKRDGAKRQVDDLMKNRLKEFMSGFSAISLKLKEMYQMITMGGNAELELVDSLDPFSEGIVFSVMPPKKSWKNIANLSGGEKTLSSLALVFALHHFKPTPLYVMDEIDAALDFRNVSIVANYIKERTKNAQFVIISLRNNMFELADRLVGIYKTDNTTKSITIDPLAVG